MTSFRNIVCSVFLIVISNSSIGQDANRVVGKWEFSKNSSIIFNTDSTMYFLFSVDDKEDTAIYDYHVISEVADSIMIKLTPRFESDLIENLTLIFSKIKKNKVYMTVHTNSKVAHYGRLPRSCTLKRIKK